MQHYSRNEIREISYKYETFLKELKESNKIVKDIDDYIIDLETVLSELKDTYKLREEDEETRYSSWNNNHLEKEEQIFIELMNDIETKKFKTLAYELFTKDELFILRDIFLCNVDIENQSKIDYKKEYDLYTKICKIIKE